MNKSPLLAVMLLIIGVFFLSGCSSSSSSTNYTATMAEGRAAATEIMQTTGASSISLAFMDGKDWSGRRRSVWRIKSP